MVRKTSGVVMAIADKDFQDLRDKVNTLGQRQDEVVIPALAEIKHVIENMSFVSVDQYAKDMAKLEKWKKTIEEQLVDVKPAAKFFNALNSRWTQLLIGGLIVAAIVAVYSQLSKVGIG